MFNRVMFLVNELKCNDFSVRPCFEDIFKVLTPDSAAALLLLRN